MTAFSLWPVSQELRLNKRKKWLFLSHSDRCCLVPSWNFRSQWKTLSSAKLELGVNWWSKDEWRGGASVKDQFPSNVPSGRNACFMGSGPCEWSSLDSGLWLWGQKRFVSTDWPGPCPLQWWFRSVTDTWLPSGVRDSWCWAVTKRHRWPQGRARRRHLLLECNRGRWQDKPGDNCFQLIFNLTVSGGLLGSYV